MQIKDSKSLAQNGYAQKNKDVDALTVLIEKGRHDHNVKLKWVIVIIVYFIYVLEYRYAVLSRGMQHQWV